jgi:tetratricopeptide (TPR) repeat protein
MHVAKSARLKTSYLFPSASLSFFVDLLSAVLPGEYEQETWQLNETEKLLSIPQLQSEGNACFAKGELLGAKDKYFTALNRVELLLLKEHPASSEVKALNLFKVPLLLNYSLCLMRIGESYEALNHLDTALSLDPSKSMTPVDLFYVC